MIREPHADELSAALSLPSDPFGRTSQLPADLVDRAQRRQWAREVSDELLRQPPTAARLFWAGILARIGAGDASVLGSLGVGKRRHRVAQRGVAVKKCR